ncbi:hypothetical protein EYF80_017511 [Liparis tanakae]|uniref:Uncharacterized protein n=1 Tax=Liparis tanakae TaxID=230148 RepID=A0A4Z2I2L5_9TELE|nr:hypothetical protein EYF80_017511 [Liparis tanakae]
MCVFVECPRRWNRLPRSLCQHIACHSDDGVNNTERQSVTLQYETEVTPRVKDFIRLKQTGYSFLCNPLLLLLLESKLNQPSHFFRTDGRLHSEVWASVDLNLIRSGTSTLRVLAVQVSDVMTPEQQDISIGLIIRFLGDVDVFSYESRYPPYTCST